MRNKKIAIKLVAVVVAFALYVPILYTTISIMAGTTTVNVGVMADSEKIVLLSVNGEGAYSVVTYTADNTIDFKAIGTGVISIIDPVTSHVYFTTTKIDPQWLDYTAFITLPAIGIYDLVLSYDVEDGSVIDIPIIIDYRALPLPPVTGTGFGSYFYVGGYAVKTLDVVLLALVPITAGLLIFFWVYRDRDEDNKLTADRASRRAAIKAASTKKKIAKKNRR